MTDYEKNLELLNKPKIKAWSEIFSTYRSVFSYLDAELQKKHCSISKFQILLSLYFTGPMTPVEISRKLSTSRANTTTFLRRISDDGLIGPTQERGTIKRPAYKLTKNGMKYFEEIFPQHILNVEKVLENFSKDTKETLNKIKKNIDGAT